MYVVGKKTYQMRGNAHLFVSVKYVVAREIAIIWKRARLYVGQEPSRRKPFATGWPNRRLSAEHRRWKIEAVNGGTRNRGS